VTFTVGINSGRQRTGTVAVTGQQSGSATFTITQFALTDIEGTGGTTVADVQLIINEALGAEPANNDLNYDGVVNAVDVQIVIDGITGTETLTVNGTNSNTATISFDYVEPNLPGGQCVSMVDTASNATSYSWSTSTNSAGNWLLANNAFSGAAPQNLAASYGACIQISLYPAFASNLPSGAYSGAVVVTSISGSSATINVNLYISAGVATGVTVTAQNQSGSGAIYAFPNVAANSSIVQQETFTVSAAAGYSLGSPTLASTGGDFTMSTPTVNNNALTFTVTSNSTGLIAGLYTAIITVPNSSDETGGNTVITVVQPVGQSGTATGGNTTTTTVPPENTHGKKFGTPKFKRR
jgi:hypothetical protein